MKFHLFSFHSPLMGTSWFDCSHVHGFFQHLMEITFNFSVASKCSKVGDAGRAWRKVLLTVILDKELMLKVKFDFRSKFVISFHFKIINTRHKEYNYKSTKV